MSTLNYDFNYQAALTENASARLWETVKNSAQPDLKGIGYRIFSAENIEIALFLPEIFCLFFHDLKAATGMSENLFEGEIPLEWFTNNHILVVPQIALPSNELPNSLAVHTQTQFVLSQVSNTPLIDARKSLNLPAQYPKGNGVKIAIVDRGLNLPKDTEVNDHLILGENQGEIHGQKVASVLTGFNFSIAPNATYLYIEVGSSPASIIMGIYWAAKNGAQLINVSLHVSGDPLVCQRIACLCESLGSIIINATTNVSTSVSALSQFEGVISAHGRINPCRLRPLDNENQYKIDCISEGWDVLSLVGKQQAQFIGDSAACAITCGALAVLSTYIKLTGLALLTSFFRNLCHKRECMNTGNWGQGLVEFPDNFFQTK